MAHGQSPRHSRKRPTAAAKAASLAKSEASSATRKSGSAKGQRKTAEPVLPAGAQRLQKLLASAGFGSRRDVERFVTEERVTVNGRVAKLGDRADPMVDEVRFDGERLARERPTYWILNKPRGVVTTVRDNEGRRTVIDLLPPSVGRVFPVGRLDKETSGLLLMTNDGELSFTLLHPSLGNEREYRVSVKGHLDGRAITRLSKGVHLEEGRTSPAQVDGVRYDSDSDTTSLSLTLMEGKKRQIRRSLLFLGYPVRRLVRVRMGPLRIGRLKVGEARALRSEEKRELLEHVRRLRAGEAPKPVAKSKATKPTAQRLARSQRGESARTRNASGSAGRPTRSAKPARGKPAERAGASARRASTQPTREGASSARPGTQSRRPSASAKRASPSPKRASTSPKRASSSTKRTSTSSSAPVKRKANSRPTRGKGAAKKSVARKSSGGPRQRTARSKKGTRK